MSPRAPSSSSAASAIRRSSADPRGRMVATRRSPAKPAKHPLRRRRCWARRDRPVREAKMAEDVISDGLERLSHQAAAPPLAGEVVAHLCCGFGLVAPTVDARGPRDRARGIPGGEPPANTVAPVEQPGHVSLQFVASVIEAVRRREARPGDDLGAREVREVPLGVVERELDQPEPPRLENGEGGDECVPVRPGWRGGRVDPVAHAFMSFDRGRRQPAPASSRPVDRPCP
jgi:hypothetical protein